MRKFAAFILGLVCFGVSPAFALQCGNRIVSQGEAKVDVWRKCGEPVTTDWRVTYRALTDHDPHTGSSTTIYVPVVIEVWVYNFGPQRFMQELSFEEGRLIDVNSLGYGY